MSYGDYASINIGFPSLIPPLLAMGLALSTKEVVSSLTIGCISAVIIYSIAVLKGMVPGLEKANPVDVLFTVMGTKIADNIYIVLFLILMGGLITLISVSGGSKAYGDWAQKAVKGKRPALFATAALGCFMFLDDYFNAITTGTVMRAVTDVNKISKPKVAYIVHTVATNMCITIPLSSWAAAIVAQIKEAGVDNSFVVFLHTIQYNLYSILSFIFIILTIIFNIDFSRMKVYEDNMDHELNITDGSIDTSGSVGNDNENKKGTVWDLVAPILVLVILSIYFMFYLGGLFDGSGKSINQALYDTSAPRSLLYACFYALITSLILYVSRGVLTFRDWMENFKEGMKTMIPTITILVLAWSISGTSGDLLQTGRYVGDLVARSPIPSQMIPAVIFFVGMALSFSMGTAWGTFGILIPIVVNICSGENAKYLEIALSACLCGSVFGDNTSPISDTTILASSSTQCTFLVHVSTQLPYASLIAIISIIGYIIAGFTTSAGVTLISSIALLVITLFVIYIKQKNVRQLPVTVKPPENPDDKKIEDGDYVEEKPIENGDYIEEKPIEDGNNELVVVITEEDEAKEKKSDENEVDVYPIAEQITPIPI